MSEVVTVSSIDQLDKLKAYLEELFKKGQFEEITEAIGMYSIFIDPQHTISDQSQLYRLVLGMIKNSINKANAKKYSSWFVAFPKLMAALVKSGQVVTDKASADVLASHHNATGGFTSVDEFFFWALDDRRLPLEYIVKYLEKTVEMHGK